MFSKWKKQNPPKKKKSFLWKFKDEILEMRREEYTFKQIREALISEYKISTTIQNISYFYNKIKQENHQSKNITSINIQEQNTKDIKPIPNQNQSIETKEKSNQNLKD